MQKRMARRKRAEERQAEATSDDSDSNNSPPSPLPLSSAEMRRRSTLFSDSDASGDEKTKASPNNVSLRRSSASSNSSTSSNSKTLNSNSNQLPFSSISKTAVKSARGAMRSFYALKLLGHGKFSFAFLFGFRAVAFILCLAFLFWGISMKREETYLAYFTNISFVLVLIYFWLSVQIGWTADKKESAVQSFGWKIKFLRLLFPLVFSASMLASIIYWALLHDPNDWTGYTIFSHGGTALLLCADLILNRFRFTKRPFVATIGFFICYFAFAISWWGFTGRWIYKVFDFQANPLNIINYAVTLIALPLLYGFGKLLTRVRYMIASRNIRVRPNSQYNINTSGNGKGGAQAPQRTSNGFMSMSSADDMD